MKRIFIAAVVAALPALAAADGFVMSAGRWTCGQVLEAWNGKPIDKGQVAGWVLG